MYYNWPLLVAIVMDRNGYPDIARPDSARLCKDRPDGRIRVNVDYKGVKVFNENSIFCLKTGFLNLTKNFV